MFDPHCHKISPSPTWVARSDDDATERATGDDELRASSSQELRWRLLRSRDRARERSRILLGSLTMRQHPTNDREEAIERLEVSTIRRRQMLQPALEISGIGGAIGGQLKHERTILGGGPELSVASALGCLVFRRTHAHPNSGRRVGSIDGTWKEFGNFLESSSGILR